MKSIKPFLTAAIVVMLALNIQAARQSAGLDTAFGHLLQIDFGQDKAPIEPIWQAVTAAENDPVLRTDLEQRLIGVLKSDASNAAKDYACRCLKLVGSEACVAALAELLDDEALAGLARFALETIPEAAVDQALREALPRLSGNLQIGVISSLGDRADTGAVEPLTRLLASPDQLVAEAAALSLGKIGTQEAAAALEAFQEGAPTAMQAALWNARLEAADRLLTAGKRRMAAPMFRAIFDENPSGYLHLAGFRGIVMCQPRRANGRILRALNGDDVQLRNMAAQLIVELPGETTPAAILTRLPDLPSAAQIGVLSAIRQRRDATAHDQVAGLLRDSDAAVRVAAMGTLAVIGNTSDVGRLSGVAVSGGPKERQAATDALAKLPGEDINPAIVAGLERAKAPRRAVLLDALAAREAVDQAGVCAEYLGDSSPEVRATARNVIAILGDERQIPALIKALKNPELERERKAVASSLSSICGRVGDRAAANVLAGLRAADNEEKVLLLQLLDQVGGERSLDALRAASRDANNTVSDAAIRELTSWPDAAAIPDLKQLITESDRMAYRVLAYRGYVNLLRKDDGDAGAKLRRLRQAVRMAPRPEDRKLVLGALGEVASAEALIYASEFLEEAGLVNEAAAAVASIAAKLNKDQAAAIAAAMRKVMAGGAAQSVKDSAAKEMKRLGISR